MAETTSKLLNSVKRIPPGSGRLCWKLVGGEIHVYDSLNVLLHSVSLTPSEKAHLDAGGKIVVVHACGTEMHMRLPHFG
jgi:hypothetical protein